MKRGLLFLIVFLLSIASVSAVEITYTNVQEEALPGGEVSYNLEMYNNEDLTLRLNFRTADLNWVLSDGDEQVYLSPGETKNHVVTIEPLSENRIAPGNYIIRLVVSTQLTDIEKVLTAKVLRYDEVITADFVDDPIIDPRRGAILRLNVLNEHSVELNNMNLELESEHFRFTRTFSLGKSQSTALEFPVSLDPDTVRGDYTTHLKVSLNNNGMLDTVLPYRIDEYKGLKEVKVPQTGFLIGGETITQTNEGNTPVTETTSRTFGWFSYRFTSFNPEPNRLQKTDEGYVAQWDVALAPGESVTLSYKINYRLPVIILILIIAGLAAWYVVRQRNAIIITKRVFAMHTETGSVRVMKVLLNIRNRGAVTVNNVRVVDRIPNIIKAPTQHGAVKPSHVKAAPDGTVMVWDIHSVRPGEEKIISYRIEGNIKVLGRLTLPAAVAKYVLFGRGVAARSFTVSLSEKK